MRVLLIGGPADGEVLEINARRGQSWMVYSPNEGLVPYSPFRFAAGDAVVTVYALGVPDSGTVLRAILRAAGLEADQ